MESGRFLLAVVLMIATVVLINVMFPPARPPRNPTVDSIVGGTPPPIADSTPTPDRPAPRPRQPIAPTVAGTAAETLIVQSPLFRYALSTHGAQLVSAELLRYESFTRGQTDQGMRPPVQLVPASSGRLLGHRVRVDGRDIDFSKVRFSPVDSKSRVLKEGDAAATIRMAGKDESSQQTLELAFTFQPGDYLTEVMARVNPGGRSVQILLDLGPTLAVNEANATEDRRALAYVVNGRQSGIQNVPLQSVRPRRDDGAAGAVRIEEGPLDWIALKNKYFLVAALPRTLAGTSAFGGLMATDAPGRWSVDLTATLPAGSDQQAGYQLYIGPQDYDRQIALGLEDVNPMGWRWLRPIMRPLGHAFTWVLLSSHRATGLPYGWVIILFGFAVRLALWPLNAKAMRSQLKSMELQPRMKDIQTRYKANPELMQKEMLKLYREEGFNPMGGCLPILLPMPVLIALFFVFQSTIEFRGVSFAWLPDLSRADPLFILPILLGVTMFIGQWLSLRTSPPNPQAQVMLWVLPGMMTFFFLNFASGLNLYYVAQQLAGFPQQLKLIQERREYQASRGLLAKT
ncbi:MAG: membrane protein insertase YidC [Longimicrobiales bacterium]